VALKKSTVTLCVDLNNYFIVISSSEIFYKYESNIYVKAVYFILQGYKLQIILPILKAELYKNRPNRLQ
jgi:glycosylphosphatidylinositol transamidase (GPIT) subunit GPI8